MHKLLKRVFFRKSAWEIGISKCKIADFPALLLPVYPAISKADIVEREVAFVADPFLFQHKGLWYCFFELKDKDKNKGVIAMCQSEDLKNWHYQGVVLEESYHLSYPFVFTYEDNIYMIPEGGEDHSVKLYKADDTLKKWHYLRTLLDGEDFRDTTLFIKEGIFYFFTSINANDNLHLYTAKSLEDQLVAHPQNPLCENNSKYSRSGGNIIEIDDKIYRFAQDCSRRYGEKLHLLEITSLSEKHFSQKHIRTFLAPDIQKEDWKSRKMHHFSSVKHGNSLIFAIDGEGWESRF